MVGHNRLTYDIRKDKKTKKEEGRMKKIICLIAVVLMIAGVAIAQKKAGITAKDLAGLKGTWAGSVSFGIMQAVSTPATLEILNDTVPVKAKLTLADVPSQIATPLGLMSGQNVFESDDGTITTDGTIMWVGKQPKNFFEVSGGGKQLHVYYYFQGMKGDGTFKKK
jgi:hypothetical protein